MGVYYKLVDTIARERVELDRLDGGGIKIGSLCLGNAARLFTFLHAMGHDNWTVINDTSSKDGDMYYECEEAGPMFYEDKTEHWVNEYNSFFPNNKIQVRNAQS